MLFGLLLLILTIASCSVFAFHPAWFPLPISAEALLYDRQFTRTLWITGIIFIVLQVLLAWTVLRGRRRPGGGREPRFLEAAWLIATAVLFLTMAGLGSRGWAKVASASADKETIEVYAHQFAWNFRYAGPDRRFGRTKIELISDSGGNPLGIDPGDPDGKDDIVTANLRVPAGRDVLLLLHSRDVIHDFFVRELRTKQDIVPGMEIPLGIRVEIPGQYEIACAELCGLGHSQMRAFMIAMPAGDYDRWKAALGVGAVQKKR
jgi:cytochrome c oxidase subunit 2